MTYILGLQYLKCENQLTVSVQEVINTNKNIVSFQFKEKYDLCHKHFYHSAFFLDKL